MALQLGKHHCFGGEGCSAEAWPQVSCSHAWQNAHAFGMTCSYENQVLRLHSQRWLSAQKWSPAQSLDRLQRKLLTDFSSKKGKFHVYTNLNFWRHGRGRGVGGRESSHVTFTQTVDKDRPIGQPQPRSPTGFSWGMN